MMSVPISPFAPSNPNNKPIETPTYGHTTDHLTGNGHTIDPPGGILQSDNISSQSYSSAGSTPAQVLSPIDAPLTAMDPVTPPTSPTFTKNDMYEEIVGLQAESKQSSGNLGHVVTEYQPSNYVSSSPITNNYGSSSPFTSTNIYNNSNNSSHWVSSSPVNNSVFPSSPTTTPATPTPSVYGNTSPKISALAPSMLTPASPILTAGNTTYPPSSSYNNNNNNINTTTNTVSSSTWNNVVETPSFKSPLMTYHNTSTVGFPSTPLMTANIPQSPSNRQGVPYSPTFGKSNQFNSATTTTTTTTTSTTPVTSTENVVWGPRVTRRKEGYYFPRRIEPDTPIPAPVKHQLVDRSRLYETITVGRKPGPAGRPTDKVDFQKKNVTLPHYKSNKKKKKMREGPKVVQDFFMDPKVTKWDKDKHLVDYSTTDLMDSPFLDGPTRPDWIVNDDVQYHLSTSTLPNYSAKDKNKKDKKKTRPKPPTPLKESPQVILNQHTSGTSDAYYDSSGLHSVDIEAVNKDINTVTESTFSFRRDNPIKSTMDNAYNPRKGKEYNHIPREIAKAHEVNANLHDRHYMNFAADVHSEVKDAVERGIIFSPKSSVTGLLMLSIHSATDLNLSTTGESGFASFLSDASKWFTCGINHTVKSDPFIAVDMGYPINNGQDYNYSRMMRSPTVYTEKNPVWNTTMPLLVFLEKEYFSSGAMPKLRISVHDDAIYTPDSDHLQDNNMKGWADVDIIEVLQSAEVDTGVSTELVLHKFDTKGRQIDVAKLLVTFKFFYQDIGRESTPAVDLARFPLTKGNHVTFYQDSPYQKNMSSTTISPSFNQAQMSDCWTDLYKSIETSKKFIYIVGSVIDYQMKLGHKGETFGDLLMRKNQEGVAIFIIASSRSYEDSHSGTPYLQSLQNAGVHVIHVEDGLDTIQSSGYNGTSVVTGLTETSGDFGSMATPIHQSQKVIVMDSGPTLQGFVGGLDRALGKIDDRLTSYEPQDDKVDAHSAYVSVIGPAGFDILENFVERARSQAPEWTDRITELLMNFREEAAIDDLENHSNYGGMDAQVIRSIDHRSCCFNPYSEYALMFPMGDVVEKTIQMAYIKNICRAKRFLYIENQVFLGSNAMWQDPQLKQINCNHHIPRAIVEKISQKIDSSEDFHAYIVIPLHPEGDAHSEISQKVLQWQWNTIKSMYHALAEVLRRKGSGRQPADYLSFYFLGKKKCVTTNSSLQVFGVPIDVNSKLMIVDDTYIILGSANINERSLAGDRDSELAIHCWEPEKREGDNYRDVHRSIYGFRSNLWRGHLNGISESFDKPGSSGCVAEISLKTSENLNAFVDNATNTLPYGQLCRYPIDMNSNNTPSFNMQTFAQVGGNI